MKKIPVVVVPTEPEPTVNMELFPERREAMVDLPTPRNGDHAQLCVERLSICKASHSLSSLVCEHSWKTACTIIDLSLSFQLIPWILLVSLELLKLISQMEAKLEFSWKEQILTVSDSSSEDWIRSEKSPWQTSAEHGSIPLSGSKHEKEAELPERVWSVTTTDALSQ